jgi:hypothetical protein
MVIYTSELLFNGSYVKLTVLHVYCTSSYRSSLMWLQQLAEFHGRSCPSRPTTGIEPSCTPCWSELWLLPAAIWNSSTLWFFIRGCTCSPVQWRELRWSDISSHLWILIAAVTVGFVKKNSLLLWSWLCCRIMIAGFRPILWLIKITLFYPISSYIVSPDNKNVICP